MFSRAESFFNSRYVERVGVRSQDGRPVFANPLRDERFAVLDCYTDEALEKFPEIREKAGTITISGAEGREYTYYITDPSLTKEIVEKYGDELEREAEEFERELDAWQLSCLIKKRGIELLKMAEIEAEEVYREPTA